MAQDISPKEQRRGTNVVMIAAASLGAVLFVGVLAWPLLPGPETGTPRGYGTSRSNQQNSAAGSLSNDASGQSNVGKADQDASEDPTGGKARRINATAEPLSLSAAQRDELRAFFARSGGHRVNDVAFSLAVGGAVPAQAELQPLPAEVSDILQGYKGDQYVVVRDQLIVVDHTARRIVAIVPGMT